MARDNIKTSIFKRIESCISLMSYISEKDSNNIKSFMRLVHCTYEHTLNNTCNIFLPHKGGKAFLSMKLYCVMVVLFLKL